jgi:hypothetical protein
MASSVATAGINLTGIKTRERRRLPDQSEGGGMTQTRTPTKGSSNLGRAPLMARGTKWNAHSDRGLTRPAKKEDVLMPDDKTKVGEPIAVAWLLIRIMRFANLRRNMA